MNYLSVCAGIEAASVAWHPLGWRACLLSEIEKFPRRVLAHHYPETPLWGDFTALRVRHLRRLGIPLPQILIGGTPCQAFSVAGLRRSLQDARGNLSLSFVRLAHALANAGSLRNVVWENVPGVLSTRDNAFGCFLGALVGSDAAILPPGGRSWPSYGMVSGPKGRAAWAVKDAQYFGLAQRRRRVFVVADFGNGADPAAVLFEPESLPRHSPPSREAGQSVAGTVAGGARGRGGYSHDDIPLTAVAFGGNNTTGQIDVATALNAHGGPAGRRDFESETFIVHTLRAEGFDASEDGTGRGTPIAFDPRQTDVPVNGDIVGALDASYPGPAVCFSAKDSGGDAMLDLAPTLRAGGHAGSHANAGVMPAVAFAQNTRDELREMPITGALAAQPGMKQQSFVRLASQVRRLTPVECERLQGFPDNYTRLPDYDADGPRYKALGNSFPTPVIEWIGIRLQKYMPAANDNARPEARHVA